MKHTTPVFLSYAFRPFFLLGGIFAILAMLAWLMTLHGSGLMTVTPLWHSHEMLMGFTMAAVAGFSLTAVANWTGRPPVHGTPLAWLVVCWLAGRLAMALSAWIPGGIVAMLDLLFPVLLCVVLGREIIGGRSRRNYGLVVIMVLMAVLNGLYHVGVNGIVANVERLAIYLLIHTVLLLVTIITGRIVPSFTANWLRQQGHINPPVIDLRLNHITILLTVLAGLSASFAPQGTLTGILAFAAALAHGLRLSRWRGFATTSNPLLFVLHLAYIWLPVGYALLGCVAFGWLLTSTAALHALTVGAIGSIVLAVTTRVALGHTGRPLQAARMTVVAYGVFTLAAMIRVAGPLTGDAYLLLIDLSAAGWLLSFALFSWVYWPILTRPRL